MCRQMWGVYKVIKCGSEAAHDGGAEHTSSTCCPLLLHQPVPPRMNHALIITTCRPVNESEETTSDDR